MRLFSSGIAVAGFLAAGVVAAATSGCDQSNPVKNEQAEKAAEAANSIRFSGNAEIDNIKRRLQLTSNPGQIGFIVLLNEMGQVVRYDSVKGKITSGQKRLTKPTKFTSWGGNLFQTTAPSDEGTYGSSSPYVFFWTTKDEYVQWNGKYLYSDKPFRLTVKPIVLSVEKEEKK